MTTPTPAPTPLRFTAAGPGTTEPVFAEPWQAQAFAMVLSLHAKGLFTWPQWAAALSHRIADAQACGDPDQGDTYYQHWLAALEDLVEQRGVAAPGELHTLAHAWEHAAERTPHGQPVELQPRDYPSAASTSRTQ